MKDSDMAFICKLVALRYAAEDRSTMRTSEWRLTFENQLLYSGRFQNQVEIAHPAGATGGFIFTEELIGASFLVFADLRQGRWETDACLPNRSLGVLDRADLEAIGQGDLLGLGTKPLAATADGGAWLLSAALAGC